MSDKDQIGQINSTLQEGDLLSTSSGAFAEIEFPDATFLRLAGGTRVIVETVSPRILIAVETGAVYLSRGEISPAASVVTSAARIALDVDTLARVNSETAIPDVFVD